MSDVSKQEHYTNNAIEPIDYIVKNKLDFLEGNIIKYVTRYKSKNGVEDLRKAKVYLNWLIDRETLNKVVKVRVKGDSHND